MRVENLIKISSEICRIVFNSSYPSDKLLSDFFREKKHIGSKERKFASNTIYFLLRNYLFLENSLNFIKNLNKIELSNNNFENLIYLALFYSEHFPNYFPDYPANEMIARIESDINPKILLNNFFKSSADFIFQELEQYFIKLNKQIEDLQYELTEEFIQIIENRYSFPKFFLLKLFSTFKTKEELLFFLENSIKQAPIFLRVNTLKTKIEDILQTLQNEQIAAIKSPITNNAIILQQRVQLTELEIFKSGKVEVQDEGSQIISYVLDPQENDSVLDACAGAGGKSLHIADLMKDKGLIVANDIEFKRLKEIPKRANRCGIISIQTHFLDLRNKRNELLNLNKKKLFDKVLVDAPCSGSGTIRRDPMKKYRINDKLISKLSENQLNILEYYSKYVKKNGILVYSTCSILPQENKNIVSSFLKLHPEFIPDDISNSLEKFNIKVGRLENNFMFSIDFRDANSDGFFMAKLRRI